MHSSVLGCEWRPFSASIMSRSCFASLPVYVYKFSSHYLNNIIFIDNSLGALARESPCITLCMLHYNPRHVSGINMPIFRRTNCTITASGIVTLCKQLYNTPDESRLQSSLLSSGILYSRLQRVTIPDAVIIQFVLLKMGMLMLETCRGL